MSNVNPPDPDSTVTSLPLVVGVTGHRDFRQQDKDELTQCVRAVFQEIKNDYPHSPIVMLSPLADGADRLVARIAKDEFSARLVVPLPMPRDMYERDFNETLTEFNNMVAAAEWFELPLVDGATEEDIREYGPKRDRQYALVGQYIVEHCQILIALWDGKDSDKAGGTAETVALKLKAVSKYYGNLPDPVESGFVYHVLTPRQSEADMGLKPRLARKLFPTGFESEEQAEASYAEIYTLVDKFNEDAIELSPKLSSLREESRKFLYPDDYKVPLPDAAKATRERYVVADTLARYFQRKMLSALKRLHILVFIAAVFFEAFAHLNRFLPAILTPWSLYLYIVILMAAYVWIDLARGRDYQNKYQDHRALAEGMRVQFYWGLAGLHDSVADCYLRKQRSEIKWIRFAIRIWSFLASIERRASGPERIGKDQIQSVIERWVKDQHGFFKKTSASDEKELKRYERDVVYLLGTGLVLAAFMFLLYVLKPHVHDFQISAAREWITTLMTPTEDDRLAHHIIIVLMGLAPVGAALLHNYAHKKALAEHVKEYKRMETIFDQYRNGLQTLADSGEYSETQTLIRELGEEALMENGAWLHLHRERPLEVPQL